MSVRGISASVVEFDIVLHDVLLVSGGNARYPEGFTSQRSAPGRP
jgi:hypothetical protein